MESFIQLVCPEHRQALSHSGTNKDSYICGQGCTFKIVADVPRFVPEATYADSFGLQWNVFRKTQLDSFTHTTLSQDRLRRIAGGDLGIFSGKQVLDAGCGAGRFTEIMLAAGAQVFAVDLSVAVEANFSNFNTFTGYFVCQADIWKLPVAEAQFDIVVCVGVIQHTPDPETTIEKLCTCLKPGGILLIDHYPPDYPVTPSRRLLRALLLKSSPRFALRFCEILVAILWPIHRAIWWAASLPGMWSIWFVRKLRSVFLYLSPIVDYQSAYPQLGPALLRTWALLDTHDTLTDRFKHLRSAEQIRAHLAKCGMRDIETELTGNGVEARARNGSFPLI